MMVAYRLGHAIGGAILLLAMSFCGIEAPTESLLEGAQTFYLDSEGGDDSHCGLHPDTAWRTLEPLDGQTLLPGTQVLFRAGSVFEGHLNLSGQGNSEAPIELGKYGEGPLPKIVGQGRPYAMHPNGEIMTATIRLDNVAHWIIRDLAITHPLPERGFVWGLFINADGGGHYADLTLRGLHVHNVSGSVRRGGAPAGIGLRLGRNTAFDGVLIEDCYIHDVGFYGIVVDGWLNRNRARGDYFPSRNVVIRNNLLHDIIGDGIVPIICEAPLVEHNEVHRHTLNQTMGEQEHAAGIWPFGCDDAHIRYNRVMGGRGVHDGEAYNVDNDNRNAVIEYNYSQNNGGGFLLMCTFEEEDEERLSTGTVVRYNVSINDGYQPWGRNNVNVGEVEQAVIENNIFAFTLPGEVVFTNCWDYDQGMWARDITFRRNLIYSLADTLRFNWGEAEDIRLDGNIYWGVFDENWNKKDPDGVVVDPQFADVQAGDFRLPSDSPVFAHGFRPFSVAGAGLTADSSWLRERDASLERNPEEWAVPIPKGYFETCTP